MTETLTAESTCALLNRAADHLDALDNAATPTPWRAIVDEQIASVDALDGPTFLCPDCGVGGMADHRDAALIVALRRTAAPLAAWLRSTASRTASGNSIPGGRGIWLEPALAVARAVLGETDGTR